MNLLSFESSAKTASVALLQDGVLIGEYTQNCGQTHSRTLLKMAEDLIKNCGLTISDVSAVAVAAGPGSFTGLRIGIAAAKGFAWGGEMPCIGVSTLEAMAIGKAQTNCVLCCAMDARRNQVYNALFSFENGALTRLCEDRAISVEDLEKELKKIKKVKIMVGDGAKLCYNTFDKNSEYILLPEHLRYQSAAGVALCAYPRLMSGDFVPAGELKPNYIRISQAERERAEKLKSEV